MEHLTPQSNVLGVELLSSPSSSTATPNAPAVKRSSNGAVMIEAGRPSVKWHPGGAILRINGDEYLIPREVCKVFGEAFTAFSQEPLV